MEAVGPVCCGKVNWPDENHLISTAKIRALGISLIILNEYVLPHCFPVQ